MKDKRIKCIYCKKPIHIDNFAGITKEGMICGKTECLMELAKKMKKRENKLKRDLFKSIDKLNKRNLSANGKE